jgi:hypothetical protein
MHGRSRHCSSYQFVVFCQEVTAWHISSLDASFPHFSIWHQSVALSFGYQGRLCVDCGHPSQITHEKRVDLECETSLVHWEATVVRFLERKKSRIFWQSNVWMFTYLNLPACSVAAVTLGPYTTDEAGVCHISTCQTILNQTSYVFCYPIFEKGHFVKESRWCLEHLTSATTYHRIDIEDADN